MLQMVLLHKMYNYNIVNQELQETIKFNSTYVCFRLPHDLTLYWNCKCTLFILVCNEHDKQCKLFIIGTLLLEVRSLYSKWASQLCLLRSVFLSTHTPIVFTVVTTFSKVFTQHQPSSQLIVFVVKTSNTDWCCFSWKQYTSLKGFAWNIYLKL